MRLLFFIHSLSSGGAERVTANLANHWARCGWDVTVVTLTDRSLDFYELDPAVRRIALGVAAVSGNALSAIANNLRRVLALRKALTAIRPNVAVSMMTTANILLALASIGFSRLLTIGSERIYPPQLPLGWLWERLRRYSYGRLSAVTALTEECGVWLARHTSVRKMWVIPNAVPWPLPKQSPVLATTATIRPGRKTLLALGRLEEQKGFGLLINVFVGLALNHPEWDLVIVGEGGLRSALETQIADLNMADRVRLPGRVGNVSDWYAESDLFVLSSRFEGFPNTLVEAMATGLPAVSFDCDTGPRDIIRNEVDGLLVPNGDTMALGDALNRLMADEALRRKFAARAVEARERFSMRRIPGMWEAMFDEVGE